MKEKVRVKDLWKQLRARRGVLAAGGALCVVLILFFVVPATTPYQAMVQSVWDTGQYPTLAFYLNRDDPTLAMEMGGYYFGFGRYDLAKATSSYNRAIALEPTVENAHYALARIYFVEGDFTLALQNINEEIALAPDNFRCFYIRALIELGQGKLSNAESDFRRFVASAPQEWAGYNDLSFVLTKEGKYAAAEQTLEVAFAQVPNAAGIPWLWNSLGLAQLDELQYTQATESFAKAAALAQNITPEEWHLAYSGNDPASIPDGINSFKEAINSNLVAAKSGGMIKTSPL